MYSLYPDTQSHDNPDLLNIDGIEDVCDGSLYDTCYFVLSFDFKTKNSVDTYIYSCLSNLNTKRLELVLANTRL